MEGSRFFANLRLRISDFAHAVRTDWGALYLIPAVLVYAVAWSYISILKFYSLHATVFDLGLEFEQLWKFVHPEGLSAGFYALTALDQPFQFLLSPVSLPASYPLLLVLQSIGLGSGAFAVYGISRNVLKSQLGAYCLSLAYLLYFPLAGVNWFDFHAQAFFIPLFLWGFFCYLTRRYSLALVLFLLGAGTTYPYAVLIVLFSGLTALELGLRRAVLQQAWPALEWRFSVILLVTSAGFFLYQLLFEADALKVSFLQSASVVSGPIPLSNHLAVVALLLAPVLVLPAFSPKWLAMLSPFAVLELASSADPFNFPTIFQIQFAAQTIPFVFIGTIYGVRTLGRSLFRSSAGKSPSNGPARPSLPFVRRPTRSEGLAMSVLVVTVGFALVFQPYGPFNQRGPDDFGAPAATTVNWTYYGEYTHLIGLIPPKTTNVLFQNNMPSMLPRPLGDHGSEFVTYLENWVNVTNFDAATNEFPLEFAPRSAEKVPIDFVVSDPNSVWYTLGGNVSMGSFFSTMYQSGFYGLVGEASGMTLLARGYGGPLEYYKPFAETIQSTALYSGGTESLSTGPFLSRSNLTGQVAWYGPYVPLSPGTYRVGLSLMTSSTLPANSLSLLAVADRATTLIANQSLSTSDFVRPGVWTTFNWTVDLHNAYSDVEFAAWYAHWRGTISIREISVTEVSPPTPIFIGAAPSTASRTLNGSG